MNQLILVRHAQTASNALMSYMGWIDEGLNTKGKEQAKTIAIRLGNQQITALYSSPLCRAIETARPLAEKLGLPIIPCEDLGELRMGEWEGLAKEEIKRNYPHEWELWRNSPLEVVIPGMDNLNFLQAKVVKVTKQIIAAHPDGTLVFVTHDAVIRVLLAYIVGSDASIYRCIRIDNASISKVQVNPTRMEITLVNDTCHLDPLKS